jgi:hypothetical protein
VIGGNGPVLWPARSPDLNPCEFFLWDRLKQIMYGTPVNTVEELTVRVNNAAESIRQNSHILVIDNSSFYGSKGTSVHNNGGGYFEHLI